MSREAKIIHATVCDAEKTIYHYESFGWELLSLNGSQITMSRETQNPAYAELVKSQSKYEDLAKQYSALQYPTPPQKNYEFKLGTCALLLLLFVVPGALYIAYEVYKHKQYTESVALYQRQVVSIDMKKKQLMDEMERVALESRATFFGKQA